MESAFSHASFIFNRRRIDLYFERSNSMKNVLHTIAFFIFFIVCSSATLTAQVIFSRFDFDDVPLTNATIGPNGTSIDPDGWSDNVGAYTNNNCGAVKGLDLVIPDLAGLFDVPSIGMTFGFARFESRADFFVRGGTQFYVTGGELYIAFRTDDGMGGFVDYGPFNTGHTVNNDGLYHEYTFIYTEASGIATVTVDGLLVWSQDGPDTRPLYWTGDPDPMVGTVMDGNCPGQGVLNYAYFFNPDVPLAVNFVAFEAMGNEDGNVALNWETSGESTTQPFVIERSTDGFGFTQVGTTASLAQTRAYGYVDVQPGAGTFYYRIRQRDVAGLYSTSETREVTLQRSDVAHLTAFPNPTTGPMTLSCDCGGGILVLVETDIDGRVVMQQTSDSGNTTIDLSSLPRGLYIIHATVGNKHYVEKVVLR
jgi:hypothetical protein